MGAPLSARTTHCGPLVEREEQSLRGRAEQLLMDGYSVDGVSGVDAAREKLAEGTDALVVSSAPDTIGVLRELRAGAIPRADATLPVLVIGADDDSAAVRYYRAGADVALPSQSSPLLVAAGLEALARRAGPHAPRRVLRVGNLTVDCDARAAEIAGTAVTLTRLEFDLLQTLASEPRKTFTRAELTRKVWGYDPQAAGPSRTVDSHAHRLRQKLEQAGAESMVQPSAASAGGSPDEHNPHPVLSWQHGWGPQPVRHQHAAARQVTA